MPWYDENFLGFIQAFTDIIRIIPLLRDPTNYILFWIGYGVSSFIVLLNIAFYLISHFLIKARKSSASVPINFLRILIVLSYWVFFIPIFGFYLEIFNFYGLAQMAGGMVPLSGVHITFMIITIILILIFIGINIFIVILYTESNPIKEYSFSR